MIHPRPNTPAHRLLLIASRSPGIRLDELAARLHPAPRLGARCSYPEWRRAYSAWHKALPAAMAVVSRLVGRLRAAGYLEPAKGPPRVEADVPDPLTPAWWRARCRALGDVPEEGDYDPASGDTAPVPAGVLVRRTERGLVADPVPEPCGYDVLVAMVGRARAGAASVAEVVGTSGHAWEVYAQACEAEVFVSPRGVRCTVAGLELLEVTS